MVHSSIFIKICFSFLLKNWRKQNSFLWIISISLLSLNPLQAITSETNLSKEELCYLSAIDLIDLFKKQVISPVDVLKAQIGRIEKFNPIINAVTYKHYEEALQQAKESEKRYKNGTPRLLEGLTCAMKDDLEVKGWVTTMGSLIRKDAVPAIKDSPLTILLKNAGVVMHIQTNVPEYYCNLVTWNFLFGTTRNPWNTNYTPGGSSGGNAAALAAGFTTLATGSDMGGSIRVPASMTGLYGFKPPYGRVPTSLIQYESQGPLGRTFEDIVIFQNAMTGPSPEMISSLKPKLIYPRQYGGIKGWRIAYASMKNWALPLDATIQKAMTKAVEILRSLGAIVEEVDLDFKAEDFDIYALGIFSTSVGPFCFNGPLQYPHLITPYMKKFVNLYAEKTSPQHASNAEDLTEAYSKKIQDLVFLKGFKAIIMPTLVSPYIAADMGATLDNGIVNVNNKAYQSDTWIYSFTWHWNLLGQYPVMNVPIGQTPEGLPLGMQIIGNTYDDLTVFQIAFNWSKIAPPFFKRVLPSIVQTVS